MNTDFYKFYGATERQDGIVVMSSGRCVLLVGFGKENTDDEIGYNWRKDYDYIPSVSEVKADIEGLINAHTDEKILTGFSWNGKQVWLSTANQQNYTNNFLAKNLPVKVRLYEIDGEASGTVAIDTEEELDVFYNSMVRHVRECVEEGWREKDAVDYEKLFEKS